MVKLMKTIADELKVKLEQINYPVECITCLFDSSIAKINPDTGECQYCELQTKLRNQAREPFGNVIKRMKSKGQYDCLVGISGGEDSSVLLYLTVKMWGLRPLVIHFNNRTNRPEATHNIKLLVDTLNVNFIEYFVDRKEYNDLTDAFLKAGVQDADLANDVAMAKLMYTTARAHGIKYILNGHSFREEGSSPKAWSLIDYTYVKSVFERWNGRPLKNYPLYTVWDQIMSGLLGIKQIRPFHYSDHNRKEVLAHLKAWGWKDYGSKHNENIYTAFVGNYLLPQKFGIDKRRTYLSARIREGTISKAQAKEFLQEKVEFNVDDLGDRRDHILNLADMSKIGSRNEYKITNFKKLKPLFWVLCKLNIVPQTVYEKYCK